MASMDNHDVDAETLRRAVARLRTAAATRTPTQPVRDLLGSRDVRAAYAVQEQLASERIASGARVVGRKIGLTSEAVQRQLGVDQPDFGVLFDDMALMDSSVLAHDAVMQPRVEAEVAFVLKHDLDSPDVDAAAVRAATDHVVAAIEVCGSRITDWDIHFTDTVADNASAGAFVTSKVRRSLDGLCLADLKMSMTIDGREVSTGSGAACLGDPMNAVVWLARKSHELGDPLRAGQIILSGALGPMQPALPGTRVEASIGELGNVTLTFSDNDEEDDH